MPAIRRIEVWNDTKILSLDYPNPPQSKVFCYKEYHYRSIKEMPRPESNNIY
jgi:hypothetical protein